MSRVPVKATRQVRPDEGETNDTRWAAIHYGSAGTPVGLRPALSLVRKAKTVQSDYAMPVHPGNVGEMQLAHVQGGVRAAYHAAEYLPGRREMLQWWADYLDQCWELVSWWG